jgi:hypothetical protein
MSNHSLSSPHPVGPNLREYLLRLGLVMAESKAEGLPQQIA